MFAGARPQRRQGDGEGHGVRRPEGPRPGLQPALAGGHGSGERREGGDRQIPARELVRTQLERKERTAEPRPHVVPAVLVALAAHHHQRLRGVQLSEEEAAGVLRVPDVLQQNYPLPVVSLEVRQARVVGGRGRPLGSRSRRVGADRLAAADHLPAAGQELQPQERAVLAVLVQTAVAERAVGQRGRDGEGRGQVAGDALRGGLGADDGLARVLVRPAQHNGWRWARLATGQTLVVGTFSDKTRPSGGHV